MHQAQELPIMFESLHYLTYVFNPATKGYGATMSIQPGSEGETFVCIDTWSDGVSVSHNLKQPNTLKLEDIDEGAVIAIAIKWGNKWLGDEVHVFHYSQSTWRLLDKPYYLHAYINANRLWIDARFESEVVCGGRELERSTILRLATRELRLADVFAYLTYKYTRTSSEP